MDGNCWTMIAIQTYGNKQVDNLSKLNQIIITTI